MKLIARAIQDPVTVIVGILLLTIFGLIALFRFPIQLTPNIDIPVITVTTLWPDASPQEVEREIIKRQEEKLKNVSRLKKMTSTSRRSVGQIRLEFEIGTSIDRARLDVSDMLRQVEEYPDKAKQPVVEAASAAESEASAWIILEATREGVYVPHFGEFIEDVIESRLRRVEGVAKITSYGGQDKEVQVWVNLPALAVRQLTLGDVQLAMARENLNVSAGDLDEDKFAYQIRGVGEFTTLEDVAEVVIAQQPGGPVYVRDVAKVSFGYREPDFIVRETGEIVAALSANREVGSNVIQVMARLRKAIAELNKTVLESKGLRLRLVYDETEYIYSAIGLVRSNLLLGGLLATAVILIFLRSFRPTLVVAASIPISVIGTFLLLSLLGRNLNVVSLAGMAFAVGMVVDNAIVVLENIYRHRQMSEDPFRAAYHGATEVWGAVLASTLTTVAVFLPVVFIREEAGQLFRDISIAISAGVALSLIVSITVIPMLSARVLGKTAKTKTLAMKLTAPFTRFGQTMSKLVMTMLGAAIRSTFSKFMTVLILAGASIAGSYLLLPPASYLPAGNRNLIITFLIFPPGYSLEEGSKIAEQFEAVLRPYWQAKAGSEEAGKLPFPPIRHLFYVDIGDTAFMGVIAQQPEKVRQLIPLINSIWSRIPGTFGYAFQPSIFGRSVSGRGNTIDIEITGDDIDHVTQAGMVIMFQIAASKELGNQRPQPNPPSFMLGGPEVQLQPDRVKLARAGTTWDQVALAITTEIDGAKVSDFLDNGNEIDLVLKGQLDNGQYTQDILQVPIYTLRGGVLPLGNLVRYVPTSAQTEITHIEEQRAVTLIVEPPAGMEIQRTMEIIDEQIVAPLRQAGQIPPDVNIRLAGTADKLVQTGRALAGGLVLALVITYLLMASLFGSFLYPLIIIFSVPLAAVGGILGLDILRTLVGQQMDVLTILGFVILIGTVVNNAILIIHQTLNFVRENMPPKDALVESVRTRIRPIFMSTLTTIFAMMPLVLAPGAGSELYRGLGAVIVGGLFVSSIFTLFLIPSLFSLLPDRWIVRSQQRRMVDLGKE
jgi:HAE1 family hydrophobic/amphiphilic exporter-1